jgi:hypothetical protein
MADTLAPSDVLQMGLEYFKIDAHSSKKSKKSLEVDFISFYGASHISLADQWHELKTTKIKEAKVTGNAATAKGFRMFLVAHHFLWAYPANAKILAKQFGINERLAKGEHLWLWIGKIAALKSSKIVWLKRFDKEDSEIIIISVDGTDCPIWEPKHATLPRETKYYSKKKNRAGVKYLVAIAVYEARVVFIDGPFPAGTSEIESFRNKLKAMIRKSKKVVLDGGYHTKDREEANMFLKPQPGYGSKDFRKYKARVRSRHESFNGKLKKYGCLNQTFRHVICENNEKHKLAFEAVCVTCQYEMDNGLPIFDAVHHNVDDDPELGTTRQQSTPSTSSHRKKKKN